MNTKPWHDTERPDWLPGDWLVISPLLRYLNDAENERDDFDFQSKYAIVWKEESGTWRARRVDGPATRHLRADEMLRFDTPQAAVVYAALTFQ